MAFSNCPSRTAMPAKSRRCRCTTAIPSIVCSSPRQIVENLPIVSVDHGIRPLPHHPNLVTVVIRAHRDENADDGPELTPPNPFYVPLDREVMLSLDGTWRFAPDPDDRGQADGWHRSGVQGRPCPVPAAWQFLFDDLRDYRGPVWYERELTVSADHAGRRVALVFAGVDYHATVWVNGRLAGTHEDGYLPFAVDVSRPGLLRSGPTGSRSGPRCRRTNWRSPGTRPPAPTGAASGGRCGWRSPAPPTSPTCSSPPTWTPDGRTSASASPRPRTGADRSRAAAPAGGRPGRV